jgi:hypothetical protein
MTNAILLQDFTYDAVASMKYLDQVFCETTRLYPAAQRYCSNLNLNITIVFAAERIVVATRPAKLAIMSSKKATLSISPSTQFKETQSIGQSPTNSSQNGRCLNKLVAGGVSIHGEGSILCLFLCLSRGTAVFQNLRILSRSIYSDFPKLRKIELNNLDSPKRTQETLYRILTWRSAWDLEIASVSDWRHSKSKSVLLSHCVASDSSLLKTLRYVFI